MARTNKYTSLNFNDIYEKKTTRPNSSSSSSSSSTSSFRSPNNKTVISNSRIHGHMLVLSRPNPKPISIPQPQPQPLPIQQQPPDQIRVESDSISLRPQGRTGSGSGPLYSSPVNPPSPLQSPLPKSNRFVPPHLRPGFVGREDKPVPDVRARPEVGIGSSPNQYGENGRPKSGGGYERMNRDSVNFMNRPRSSGARSSSSG
ncbi:hypothetical protein RND71_038123 [Anisodus tanguticus]|uniref:Uncharacterized protein n=1 Tax=Anisodus tanguticus TaxID=243964 RepID=A0AAE1UT82_9SOLA|nr:hypothetical protein RND71_038123 [Anisodus tanguticus]